MKEIKTNIGDRLSNHKTKRGCPTCQGVDAKSCMRCTGMTLMCNWEIGPNGSWIYFSDAQRELLAMQELGL